MVKAQKTIEPLNAYLRRLHGPSVDVAGTMDALVPFPDPVESFEDADILDLNVRFEADRLAAPSRATVTASVRYSTSAGRELLVDWYRSGLHRLGLRTRVTDYEDQGELVTAIESTLPNATRYRVEVSRRVGYRTVRIRVRYRHPLLAIFDRFASWHNGDAPWPVETEPTMIDISTFAQPRGQQTLVLYTTEFFGATPVETQRTMVNRRLGQQGWAYSEPRPGMLFLRDGGYPAETHVRGDETGSAVTFVGEFHLQ